MAQSSSFEPASGVQATMSDVINDFSSVIEIYYTELVKK